MRCTHTPNLPLDKQQAVSIVVATLNTITVPKELASDAGCYSAMVVVELHALGVDPPRNQA